MESSDTEMTSTQIEEGGAELESLSATDGGGIDLRPTSNISITSVGSTISVWLDKLRARPEVVFLSQMLVISIVIIVSLFNLTRGTEDTQEGKLWVVLLSSCLGYILPNPKITSRDTVPNQQ